MENARYLDVDDLYILSMLDDGVSVTAIASWLCISQPAVSLRLSKMRRVFGSFYVKHGRTITLSEKGKTLAGIARVCVGALSVM